MLCAGSPKQDSEAKYSGLATQDYPTKGSGNNYRTRGTILVTPAMAGPKIIRAKKTQQVCRPLLVNFVSSLVGHMQKVAFNSIRLQFRLDFNQSIPSLVSIE